jgi:hypothetical protein
MTETTATALAPAASSGNLAAAMFATVTHTLTPFLTGQAEPTPALLTVLTEAADAAGAEPVNVTALIHTALRDALDPVLSGQADPDEEIINALNQVLATAYGAAARTVNYRQAPARPTVSAPVGTGRTSGVRAEILAVFAANPGRAFTVTEMTHAIGDHRSSGAVGAQLITMTGHGLAAQVGEAPKTYTAGPNAPILATSAPAPATEQQPDADDADEADEADLDEMPETDPTDTDTDVEADGAVEIEATEPGTNPAHTPDTDTASNAADAEASEAAPAARRPRAKRR